MRCLRANQVPKQVGAIRQQAPPELYFNEIVGSKPLATRMTCGIDRLGTNLCEAVRANDMACEVLDSMISEMFGKKNVPQVRIASSLTLPWPALTVLQQTGQFMYMTTEESERPSSTGLWRRAWLRCWAFYTKRNKGSSGSHTEAERTSFMMPGTARGRVA